jgi:hypothetical protein
VCPALFIKYQKRIFGPILGCIDIEIEVPGVEYEKLGADRSGESHLQVPFLIHAKRTE